MMTEQETRPNSSKTSMPMQVSDDIINQYMLNKLGIWDEKQRQQLQYVLITAKIFADDLYSRFNMSYQSVLPNGLFFLQK